MVGLFIFLFALSVCFMLPYYISFIEARKEYKEKLKKQYQGFDCKVSILKPDEQESLVNLVKKTMEKNNDKPALN